jgi:hypothetical protein
MQQLASLFLFARKIIFASKKKLAPDFRRDAQALRLTRKKLPRTMRAVLGK